MGHLLSNELQQLHADVAALTQSMAQLHAQQALLLQAIVHSPTHPSAETPPLPPSHASPTHTDTNPQCQEHPIRSAAAPGLAMSMTGRARYATSRDDHSTHAQRPPGPPHVPHHSAQQDAQRGQHAQGAPPQQGEGRGEQEARQLTHVDASGRASMVDVGSKGQTVREARASCRVLLGDQAYALVASNTLAKGDVLRVAQLAGIMGAKHTALLVPLCHSLLLSKVRCGSGPGVEGRLPRPVWSALVPLRAGSDAHVLTRMASSLCRCAPTCPPPPHPLNNPLHWCAGK